MQRYNIFADKTKNSTIYLLTEIVSFLSVNIVKNIYNILINNYFIYMFFYKQLLITFPDK